MALVFLAYFAGDFFAAFYIYDNTLFPTHILLFPILLESFFFTGILWIVVLAIQRFRSWLAVFVFPVLWVSYLYLFTKLINHDSITNLPIFSQVQFLPLIQIVSLTGIYGLSFLLILFPSGLGVAWYYRKKHPKQALLSLISIFLILIANLTFGAIRLSDANSSQTVKVGLAAKNFPSFRDYIDFKNRNPIQEAEEFAKVVDQLAKQGADLILQPEISIWVSLTNQDEIFAILSRSASENKVYVLVPMGLGDRPVESNSLYVFSPDGTISTHYNKMHLVSAFESHTTPGNQLATIALSQGLIGLAICHDMDHFQPTRAYSELGVGLLFVPAGDYGIHSDGTWHAQLAIMQSVSGGFSLARAAYFGFLSASDAYGRVLAWKPTEIGKEVSVVAEVPLGHGRTFYAMNGDWFPWMCCIGALTILGFLGFRSRKHS